MTSLEVEQRTGFTCITLRHLDHAATGSASLAPSLGGSVMVTMLQWLLRFIKRIDVFGVGVEFREPPPATVPIDDRRAPQGQRHQASRADGVQPDLPNPLPLRRVVTNPELAFAIEESLAGVPPNGRLGGLTLGKPGQTRALIYVGSCPDGTDRVVRKVVKPYGYNVSSVRDMETLGGFETATLNDPKGY